MATAGSFCLFCENGDVGLALVTFTEPSAAARAAASSSGVAGDVLDVVRSQAVGLDEFIARWIGRLAAARTPARPARPARPAGRGRGGAMTARAGDAPPSPSGPRSSPGRACKASTRASRRGLPPSP